MDESYLCIDVGTSSIKVLEKDPAGNVLRWGILERPARPFHTSIQPIDPPDVADALADLLLRMGAESHLAVMSLPSFCVFTAVVDVVDPALVPANPATYKLEANELSDGRCFMVAIPKDVSEKYREIADLCGLRLGRLELESSAVARSFLGGDAKKLIVDIGDRSTTFSVIRNGSAEYIFHSDFGDASRDMNVIMNKTREIADKREIDQVFFSNSAFNIANGLQKISSQITDGHGRSGGV